jgi:hypothetical protein
LLKRSSRSFNPRLAEVVGARGEVVEEVVVVVEEEEEVVVAESILRRK